MSGSNPISESAVAQTVASARAAIAQATDLASLRAVRQATVGEQSEIAKLNAQLKSIEPDHKAAAGALIG
jgi:phenylalanyl-tRNA synthetase alpha chain